MKQGKTSSNIDWSIDDYLDELREIEFEKNSISEAFTRFAHTGKAFFDYQYSVQRETGTK